MGSDRLRAATLGLGLLAGCGAGPGPATSDTAAPAPPPPRVAVALRFVQSMGPDPAVAPTTRVVLVRIVEHEGRRTFDLGPFPGVCHNEVAPPPLLLRARCGWRDAAGTVSVRRVDSGLLVRRAGALGPSFDGDRELVVVELPRDARLEPIGPPTLPLGGGLRGVVDGRDAGPVTAAPQLSP